MWKPGATSTRPTVYFDAACGICAAGQRRLGGLLRRRGWGIVPLQSPEALRRLDLNDGESPDEVKLYTADGRIVGGVEVFLLASRASWWAWPLWLVSQLPFIRPALERLYRRIARNRYCISRACGLRSAVSLFCDRFR
jgi:predicted DCC family thiol-disulfide oxidoreductase YuxK